MRRVVAVLGAGMLMICAVGIGAHFAGFLSTTITLIASFTPLFVVLAVIVTIILLAFRQWIVAVVGVLLVVVGGWTQWPLYSGTTPVVDSSAVGVRLMQANIRLGLADTAALLRTVHDEKVDVLTVIELTDAAAKRLAAQGISDDLPYSYLVTRGGGGGAGIYSRFPLSDGRKLDGFVLNNVIAVADIPGVGSTTIYALHPLPPYPQPAWKWAGELKRLRAVLADTPRPVIIGADVNSTFDHKQYRELVEFAHKPGEPKLLDAAQYLGAGIVATFPADRWYPAVLAIDHILVAGAIPTTFRRIDIPGSDHDGVLADIRFGSP